MNRPDRTEEARAEEPLPVAERDLHERIGYARCEWDQAERALSRLRSQQQEMQRQIQAVAAENQVLEAELLQRLQEWRRLDEATMRVDDVMPQLRAVTGSLTYRATSVLLKAVNRALRPWRWFARR